MKRILCLVLCLIMSVFALTSCAEGIIGDYLDEYDDFQIVPKQEITLDVYIICGDETTKNAKDTVSQRLSQYTADEFMTKLNVHYISAAEYAATITEKTMENATDRADIILINSKAMADELLENNLLADLTEFYNGKDYGSLNVSIPESLINASKVTVTETVNGTSKQVEKLFTVPNSRLLGEYQYILIDKAEARKYYYSDNDLSKCTSLESETLLALKADITAASGNVDDVIRVVSGKYEDKAKYEAENYYCNVMTYPTVTEDVAFESAFAVVKGTPDVARAMEIIYAFNTDETIHNTLQYGVSGTNYTVDDDGNVVRITDPDSDSVYIMDLAHAGDAFLSYNCPELSWTDEVKANAKEQNNQSVTA